MLLTREVFSPPEIGCQCRSRARASDSFKTDEGALCIRCLALRLGFRVPRNLTISGPQSEEGFHAPMVVRMGTRYAGRAAVHGLRRPACTANPVRTSGGRTSH